MLQVTNWDQHVSSKHEVTYYMILEVAYVYAMRVYMHRYYKLKLIRSPKARRRGNWPVGRIGRAGRRGNGRVGKQYRTQMLQKGHQMFDLGILCDPVGRVILWVSAQLSHFSSVSKKYQKRCQKSSLNGGLGL